MLASISEDWYNYVTDDTINAHCNSNKWNVSFEILVDNIQNKSISIYLDSQSALEAINAYKIDSSLVLECKHSVWKLAKNQMKLPWFSRVKT